MYFLELIASHKVLVQSFLVLVRTCSWHHVRKMEVFDQDSLLTSIVPTDPVCPSMGCLPEAELLVSLGRTGPEKVG